MEMCYDGALVMPKNYAVVNNEKMEYVDGGWSGRQVLKNVIGNLLLIRLYRKCFCCICKSKSGTFLRKASC